MHTFHGPTTANLAHPSPITRHPSPIAHQPTSITAQGVETISHVGFEPELRRLGLHHESQRRERPALVVFSSTFHDDVKLGGGECNATMCECAEPWALQEMATTAAASVLHVLSRTAVLALVTGSQCRDSHIPQGGAHQRAP